jgi:DNA-binding NtrC family response regulator
MVGDCDAFASFRARLEQAARSTATVLLTGESGTGKSRAARALHEASPRASGPFVTVSLAALAPTLVEAELFGHEQGAFTGAHRARLGRFRQAEGGTLVLEEVDALPREQQGKLLRVVQERLVEPLGAEAPVPIDVRLVSTSQQPHSALVASGTLREDLFWRLAVVQLEVPPLRERLADLPLLADSLAQELCSRLGLPKRSVAPSTVAQLQRHAWPGNVRELENVLERALALSPDPQTTQILPEHLDFLEPEEGGIAAQLCERALAHGLTLVDLERSFLARALREARGNLTAAARKAGLTRRAFEYRWAREQAQRRRAAGAADAEGPDDPRDGVDPSSRAAEQASPRAPRPPPRASGDR